MKKILPDGVKLWIQRAPGNPHLLHYPGLAGTVEMAKQHDFAFEFILAFTKDNMLTWAYNEHEQMKIGDIVLVKMKENPDYIANLIKDWRIREDKFYSICKKIDDTNLSALSDQEIAGLFKEFVDTYVAEYAIPILTDAMGFYCEVRLHEMLKMDLKKLGRVKEFNVLLSKLTKSVDDSFIGEESHELFLLVKDHIEGKDYSEKLKEHAKKWYWIQNNYLRAIVLDEDYFKTRIEEHAKHPEDVNKKLEERKTQFGKARKEKDELIKELNLENDTQLILRLIDECCYWQDMRKKANLVGDYYAILFLQEAERRKGIAMDDLIFVFPEEIIELFKGHGLDIDEVRLRKKVTGTIFTPKKVTLYNYEDSKLLDKEIEAQSESGQIMDLRGSVANIGKIRAVVKVLDGPGDFDKMDFGNVLVTSMTRPDFLPVMKKAAAIVTDEGGMTCHAAIMSREFDIPCIVGTKIATKVLKDGMLIEVNANHGMVTIIEK